MTTYNPDNVFAKMLRGDIPCDKVVENAHALAFHDIHPKAPIHILVIPKGHYTHLTDFLTNASEDEILGLNQAIEQVIQKTDGLEDGYRMVTNCQDIGGQEVPHLHFHLIGGGQIGPMAGAMTNRHSSDS